MGQPFHLAFPVDDLEKAVEFYHGVLGCAVGRRATKWVDFDFFGNQITAHLKPEECRRPGTGKVDGDDVPVRHFGAILEWKAWEDLAEKFRQNRIPFIITPKVRFKDKPGEQGTFFIRDPAGNALEFKTFRSTAQIFDTGT